MFDRESEKFNKLVKIYNICTSLSQESTTGFPATASHVELWDGIPRAERANVSSNEAGNHWGPLENKGNIRGLEFNESKAAATSG